MPSYCATCGAFDDEHDDDECEGVQEQYCEAIALDVLDYARLGHDEEFKRQLSMAVEDGAGEEMNIVDQLICEANDAAARGDVAEARRLLDRAAHPKWDSVEECQQAYEQAMAERRGVVA